MTKKYDISKKSDMRKFERDFKKKTGSIIEDATKNMKIDIDCPHCGKSMKAKSGKNICPHCQNEVDLNINR